MRKSSRNEGLEEEGLEEGNSCFLFNRPGLSFPPNNHRIFTGQEHQHALAPLSVDSQWLVAGWPSFPTKAMLGPEQPAGTCLPTWYLLLGEALLS